MSKIIAPLLFVGNLVAILTIWSKNSLVLFRSGVLSETLIALGGLAGLLAFYFVLWQMLLISRVGWIEKPWGHDKLSHAHHIIGTIAIFIIALHPVLIVLGYSQTAQTTLPNQIWIFLTSYEGVLRAFIAYLLFLIIVPISFYVIRKRLRYEVWYLIHIFLYLAILLAFGHQLRNGHDLATKNVQIYWQILFFGSFAAVLYYRIIKPLWNFWRYKFFVRAIESETENVTSVIISGENLDKLKAEAGQFIMVRFIAKGFWSQAHPFSLSRVPNDGQWRLSIKAVGDFTSKIPTLPVGTRIIIEGPLGRFTTGYAKSNDVLLIAGGIGITPLRSLFEQFTKDGRKIDLIYAARSENDFALKDELDQLATQNARVHYMPEDRVGRLDADSIKQLVSDISNRAIYLCGPPPMMQSLRRQLNEIGIKKSQIFYEKFQLG